MRPLSSALQAHLDTGATTLAWCWRVTRRDGQRFGFTDHDMPLSFDGTSFEAATGFSASEIKSSAGFAIDNLEVTSALSSAALDETELALGHFDNAKIEIFRVNWQDTSQRVRLHVGALGEIKRAGLSFFAEVRGLMHTLDQPTGRLFQRTCDANFGDVRCGVDSTVAPHTLTSRVTAVEGYRISLALPPVAASPAAFDRGTLVVVPANGPEQRHDVRTAETTASALVVELWHTPKIAPTIGSLTRLTAGCDKRFATCRDRFANAPNFRGFPAIPGTDFVTAVATPGAAPRVGSNT